MTYRQVSEKDEEHALICLSAPKQMKHSQEPETDEEQTLYYLKMKYSQEPETDEERKKTLLTLAQRTCAYVTCRKSYNSIYYKSTQAA